LSSAHPSPCLKPKASYLICHVRTWEILSQESRSAGRNLKPGLPEYESGMLQFGRSIRRLVK
jgi:hypothetical protein